MIYPAVFSPHQFSETPGGSNFSVKTCRWEQKALRYVSAKFYACLSAVENDQNNCDSVKLDP